MWKDPTDNTWERVRVTEVNTTTRTCRIYLVDVGITYEVDNGSLRELLPKYVHMCALGCRAHLMDIKPLNGEAEWSEESIEG